MISALTLRTSSLGVDDIQANGHSMEIRSDSMRGRFAMRFGEEKNEDDSQITRADRVRTAFNSPFWPFVLATTSIGQEGLDFHPYCHAVVHWNLPSNPVDFEQREGRVYRYKGHAVRKNLAAKFGDIALRRGGSDPWKKLFELGKSSREPNECDLVPYWLFPGEAKIQRDVLALPFSREIDRLHSLRRSLAVYRMVFGQNRQEDLVTYLLNQIKLEDVPRVLDEVLIDLSPPEVQAENTPGSATESPQSMQLHETAAQTL